MDLYSNYKNLVYSVINFHVENRAEQQDLFQDVWLKIYNGYGYCQDKQRISSWIYKIARNRVYDFFRENKRQPELASAADLEKKTSINAGFESSVIQKLDLITGLKKLKDSEQEIIVYFYVMGLNYSELAKFLKIPQPTLKSRLHQARKKLRQLVCKNIV